MARSLGLQQEGKSVLGPPCCHSHSSVLVLSVCLDTHCPVQSEGLMLLAPLHLNIRNHTRITGRHIGSHVSAGRPVFGPCLNTVSFPISAAELRDLQLDSCRFPLC